MKKDSLIAWKPESTAPIELISVLINPGIIDEGRWIKVLADRVSEMVNLEENPLEASKWACGVLSVPFSDNPLFVGDDLVLYNSNLRLQLNLSLDEEPDFYREILKTNLDAEYAIKNCDFVYWVNQAKDFVSGL